MDERHDVEIPEVDERWQAHSPLPDTPEANRRGSGQALGSGALVCAIISLALCLFSPLICWITGIVAIALATVRLRKVPGDKVAKVARILGVIGIIIGAIVFTIALITSLMVTAQYYGL